MEKVKTDWTKKEFKAYVMLYAANANFFESEEEKAIVRGLVSEDTYKEIHREFEQDNDYQSIQKILHNIEKFEYKEEQLVSDIQKVFNADGEVDLLEQNMLRALKHLIQ